MAKKSKNKNKSTYNKQVEAQKRRDKRRHKRQDSDSCEFDMRIQLEKYGLGLKEVEGDGNCLFRALADQLYGSQESKKLHARLRQETVEYMRRNKQDFEPFFASDEGVDFNRHLELLAEDGTYAGNDAIVAFSRRYEVVVVIHQLNEALWKIGDDDKNVDLKENEPVNTPKSYIEAIKSKKKIIPKRKKQLHISYHNGDHYNSVRRISDIKGPNSYHEANKPANVFIDTLKPPDRLQEANYCSSDEEASCLNEENQYTEGENISATNSKTHDVNTLSQDAAMRTANKIKSTLWQEGGTGNRIFGNEVAESAAVKNSQYTKMGNKHSRKSKTKEHMKMRHKNGQANSDEENELKRCVPLAAMQALSI